MKNLRNALAVLVLALATASFASDAQASFEKLKTLEGNWAGKAMGRDLQVSFRVTSKGSAIMSEIHGPENMISMIHLDGDRLMLTHYCDTGNQPRMVGTVSPDGKSVTFNFLDVTNLLSSQPGHMVRMTLTMLDADHHTELWEFQDAAGKAQQHEAFDLQRVK